MSSLKPSNRALVSLLYISFVIALFFNFSYSLDINPQDKKVLLRVKSYLHNPTSLASWNPSKNNWCGDILSSLQCDEQGHVTCLEIRGIKGESKIKIPPFLDGLPSLRDLKFIGVSSERIPSYIGKLTKLTSFTLSLSNVTGPIPSFLFQLKNLDKLVLNSNKFTGSIPDSFRQLEKLTTLDLSFNRLNGSIPSTIGDLSRLTSLTLSFNRLSGWIPLALAGLSDLEILDLSSNEFSGTVPDFLGEFLVKLTSINLQRNKLTGIIPTFIGFLPNLTTLILSNNQLVGSVPEYLGRSSIQRIELANNKLAGDASFLFDKDNTAISNVRIANNLFKFDISNVTLAPNLRNFDISHNMIYGSLPKLFYRLLLDPGNVVDVTYNRLCGPIPNGRRLKRADPKIFAYNKCLCGGPLPACK